MAQICNTVKPVVCVCVGGIILVGIRLDISKHLNKTKTELQPGENVLTSQLKLLCSACFFLFFLNGMNSTENTTKQRHNRAAAELHSCGTELDV